jgi:hypothetical protein
MADDPNEAFRRIMDLATRRAAAKAEAIRRFSWIGANAPHDQWDALVEAEIAQARAIMQADVVDEFEKQIRSSLDTLKRVREDAIKGSKKT